MDRSNYWNWNCFWFNLLGLLNIFKRRKEGEEKMIWCGSILTIIIVVAFFAVLGFYFWILILKPALNKAKSLEKGQEKNKPKDKNKSRISILAQNNKFCDSCGASVEKDYSFCSECGKQLK